MNESEETLKQEESAVLKAIAELSGKIDALENRFNERIDALENRVNKRIDDLENRVNEKFEVADLQFEAIRKGIVENSARFDQLESVALDAKSIALIARSQLTILMEEIKQSRNSLV
jgi:predicted nuclease with TOPRIM domain